MTALGFDQAAAVLNHTLENGGGTFDHNGYLFHGKEGYALSLNPELGKVVPVDEVTATTVTAYFHDHAAEDRYLGTWVNEGQVHFDVVTVLNDLDEAMTLAGQHQQLAIYDLNENEELFVADYFAEQEDWEDYYDDVDEYTEWQDYYDGDDWDHGQYDSDLWNEY